MTDQYHYQIKIELACGCKAEQYVQLPEGEEPSGEWVLAVLDGMLMLPVVPDFIAADMHVAKGNERLKLEVIPKVGPMPDPQEVINRED